MLGWFSFVKANPFIINGFWTYSKLLVFLVLPMCEEAPEEARDTA
jgi:hypothetical protein